MEETFGAGGNVNFEQTRWSRIVGAAESGAPDQGEHLSVLCNVYWRPVYGYIRSRGFSAHDAEDLTQDFLAQVITGKILKVADPLKGRFRTFLLKCCKNFLLNVLKRNNALKRGGGVSVVSLNLTMEEGSAYDPADAEAVSPDEVFDRQWALALLQRVLDQLGEKYERDGKGAQFEALRGALTGDSLDKSYAEIGEDLDMSETNVKVAVHRMRQRYRDFIRKEIAATVGSTGDVEDELAILLDALR